MGKVSFWGPEFPAYDAVTGRVGIDVSEDVHDNLDDSVSFGVGVYFTDADLQDNLDDSILFGVGVYGDEDLQANLSEAVAFTNV